MLFKHCNDHITEINIDFRSNNPIEKALSNLYKSPFVYEDRLHNSLEGFIQSLKFKNEDEQERVARLHGFDAKKAGHVIYDKNCLYFKKHVINRMDFTYHFLLEEVYLECFKQNETKLVALYALANCNVRHSIGKQTPSQTILTEGEFLHVLHTCFQHFIGK